MVQILAQIKAARPQTWLIAALVLIGIGFIALLPPFEGFDENAHYSSMREIADRGIVPMPGSSFLDWFTIDYRLHGPVRYESLNPPFDNNGGMTYSEFFARPELRARYAQLYRTASPRPHFRPSTEVNWQSQHPPLYYFMMVPLLKATDGLSFVTQLFILRLFSFLIALAGYFTAMRASIRHAPAAARPATEFAFLIYPLAVPMFFPEFARLGNDSLCLFFMGYLWATLLRWLEDEKDWRWPLQIGAILGLGLLTKAFFLPITAAVGFFVCLRLWCGRGNRALMRARLKALALLLIPAFLIGGGWYIYKWIAFGSPTGVNVFMRVDAHGGLLANLQEKFSLYVLLHGMAATLASWEWGGTWSLARIDEIFRLPLIALTVWLGMGYVTRLRKKPLADEIWLPVWLLLPFGASLFYHMLMTIADMGTGGTPGWYLSILAPAFAAAIAQGLMHIKTQKKQWRRWFNALLLYMPVFLGIALWAESAMFAGCAVKDDDKYLEFYGHAACLDHIPQIWDHIGVLGWPYLAGGIDLGIICAVTGLVLLLREQRR